MKLKSLVTRFGKGAATDGQGGGEGDVLSGLAVIDRASCCVRGSEGDRMVGETEDVDLEIGEGVPEGGLDEGLKGRELDDRHADGLRRDERAMQVTEGRRVQAATVEDVVQGLDFLFLQTQTAARRCSP